MEFFFHLVVFLQILNEYLNITSAEDEIVIREIPLLFFFVSREDYVIIGNTTTTRGKKSMQNMVNIGFVF